MRKILVFIVAAILLSACGGGYKGPTDEQIAAGDYGSVPTKKYQEAVMKTVKQMTLNPKFDTWSNLIKGYYYRDDAYGYLGCVHVNAMNRFGVYEGYTLWQYMIHNDKVVGIQDSNLRTRVGEECASIYATSGIYGSAPTSAQLAVADYGSVPKEPQQAVIEYMKTVLRHPENARYDKWSDLRKYWLPGDDEDNEDVIHYGYMGCVYIKGNSRDCHYGRCAYSESLPTVYLIHNDKVITTTGGLVDSTALEEQLIMNLCAPLYRTNTNAEAVKANTSLESARLRQQVNSQEQPVNFNPAPVRFDFGF